MPLEIILVLEVPTENSHSIGLLQAVKGFFQQKRNYSIKAEKIRYSNETTGVYFNTYLPTDIYPGIEKLAEKYLSLLLSIPVGRSPAFILEVLEEMKELQTKFNTKMYDQEHGDVCPYDKQGLFDMWCEMNGTLCNIIQTHQYTTRYWTLPRKLIEKCWHWNYYSKELLGSARIYYRPTNKCGSNLATFVVWEVNCTAIIPKFVDYIVVAVDGFDCNTVILFQVKMPKFIEMINGFGGYCASSSDSMEILQATPPETLVQCILTQKIIKKRFQYVKEEQILEEELLCT